MAEHKRVTQSRQGDKAQKHRMRQQESKPSFEKSNARNDRPLSLNETSFAPRVEDHAIMLSRISFGKQRHEFIMRLQRTYGSKYVQRLVESVRAQAKLTVSNPNDIYEQEADRVAETVTKTMASPAQRQEEEEVMPKTAAELQRQPVEDEEELVQGKLDIERQVPEEEELLMKQNDGQVMEVSDNIEKHINSARGGGQPLSDDIRGKMESAFGADFGGVKVHTGSEANTLNQELSAKAFTTGKDIFFREGDYSPGSASGQKLIAHELTHVVQQSGGSSVNTRAAAKTALQRSCKDPIKHNNEVPANCHEWMLMQKGVPAATIFELRAHGSPETTAPGASLSNAWYGTHVVGGRGAQVDQNTVKALAVGTVLIAGDPTNPAHSMVIEQQDPVRGTLVRGFNNTGTFGPDAPSGALDTELRSLHVPAPKMRDSGLNSQWTAGGKFKTLGGEVYIYALDHATYADGTAQAVFETLKHRNEKST